MDFEFSFVPIYHYADVYYFVIMVFVIMAIYQCHSQQILRSDVAALNSSFAVFLTVAIILYIGFRPIVVNFGDTISYARGYYSLQEEGYQYRPHFSREWLYSNLLGFCATYSTIRMFFLIFAVIYVGALSLALRQIFGIHFYVPLLVFLSMFTFWSYGVNGIRNGVASSLFILALANINRPLLAASLAYCSIGFHKSMWLIVVAAVVAWFIKNSYLYIAGWLLSILVSFFAGMTLQSFISNIGVFQEDSRFQGYLTGSNDLGSSLSSMTFRWDFIAFSGLGIAFGWYFIIRRKYKDEFYIWLFNMYCLANAFWIIVIRATYSNRIAQISWFILPLVMSYPTSKKRFWTDHEKYMGYAIIIMYGFNFYYNVLKLKH